MNIQEKLARWRKWKMSTRLQNICPPAREVSICGVEFSDVEMAEDSRVEEKHFCESGRSIDELNRTWSF